MTNDEINRYIHEQIMGKCWHEMSRTSGDRSRCKHCPECVPWGGNPDYCSDDSPRSLLNEVVAKVIETCGVIEMWLYFLRQAVTPFVEQDDADRYVDALPTEDDLMKLEAMATAEQIARAAVTAHKGA